MAGHRKVVTCQKVNRSVCQVYLGYVLHKLNLLGPGISNYVNLINAQQSETKDNF